MAVYTLVTDQQLSTFLSEYDIGKLISQKGIAEGVENTNYFLKTELGDFILTLYEKRVKKENLPYQLGLSEFLYQKGLPTSLPIKDKQGLALKSLNGRTAAIHSFLPGTVINAAKEIHVTNVGNMLGKMHAYGKGYDKTLSNSLSFDSFENMLKTHKNYADKLSPDLYQEVLEQIMLVKENWPKQEHCPCHTDLFPDNVLMLENEISGLIDFYFSCDEMPIYDLAVTLNAWCFDEKQKLIPSLASSLVKGYMQCNDLCNDDIDLLQSVAKAAAIRFFLTRLIDWFETPVSGMVQKKDPKEYINIMRFLRDNPKILND